MTPTEEQVKALRDAVLKRDIDQTLYLLKQAVSAKNARALAAAAEADLGLLTLYGVCYSVVADGSKQTITMYRTGIHNSAMPVAGVTFDD